MSQSPISDALHANVVTPLVCLVGVVGGKEFLFGSGSHGVAKRRDLSGSEPLSQHDGATTVADE
jgi:hypothetical protein